ncbi:MAG TPA: response regulator [Desulfuromonadales bacterium]|nr:response regulator [Desulfuromonadales bacterium]
MKCLIVENELESRHFLKEQLSSICECDVAVHGQEAIDSFRLAHELRRPYDVIFMNITMPVVDGLTALREIRSLEKGMEMPSGLKVKAVMMTAPDDSRTVIKAFKEGEANSFLVKPITKQKLDMEMATLKLEE